MELGAVRTGLVLSEAVFLTNILKDNSTSQNLVLSSKSNPFHIHFVKMAGNSTLVTTRL